MRARNNIRQENAKIITLSMFMENYSLGRAKALKLANDCGAVVMIGRNTYINSKKVDAYLGI